MTFTSSWNPQSPQALARRESMLARIATLRALEDRAAKASAVIITVGCRCNIECSL